MVSSIVVAKSRAIARATSITTATERTGAIAIATAQSAKATAIATA
jgi:hypothetical protein